MKSKFTAPFTVGGGAQNNWPDADNNRGAAGTVKNFCDGHAEWIKISDFITIWNMGMDKLKTPGECTIPWLLLFSGEVQAMVILTYKGHNYRTDRH